jgi:hypothetical protein
MRRSAPWFFPCGLCAPPLGLVRGSAAAGSPSASDAPRSGSRAFALYLAGLSARPPLRRCSSPSRPFLPFLPRSPSFPSFPRHSAIRNRMRGRQGRQGLSAPLRGWSLLPLCSIRSQKKAVCFFCFSRLLGVSPRGLFLRSPAARLCYSHFCRQRGGRNEGLSVLLLPLYRGTRNPSRTLRALRETGALSCAESAGFP